MGRAVGVCLGAIAGLSWSYMNVLVHLNEIFDAAWMTVFIWVVATLFNILLFFIHNRLGGDPLSSITPSEWLAAWTSPTAMLTGNTLIFIAMKDCPMGDAVALYSLNMIWTPIISSIISRKIPSKSQVLSVFVAIIGVLLLTRPTFIFGTSYTIIIERYPHHKRGYLFSLLASACFSLSELLIGFFDKVHWTVWQIASTPAGLTSLPILLYLCNGFAILSPVSMTTSNLILNCAGAFLVGFIDLLGTLCNIFSIQEDTATTTSIAIAMDIPGSYLLGIIYLQEIPSALSAGGTLLICSAIIILSEIPEAIWTYLTKDSK